MKKSVVAVLKTSPEQVLSDILRLMTMAGLNERMDPRTTTILKDNISWHYPFLSANTTPWQLKGTILGLRNSGFEDLVAVHNNTVVTDAFKGGRLNKLTPLYGEYGIPQLYNFRPRDVTWQIYRPKAKDACAEPDLSGRDQDPGAVPRQEHRSPAHGEMPYLHHHHR